MTKNSLKHLITGKIKSYLISRLGVPDQRNSFQRIKALGFLPKNILDIGAYEGNWCRFIKTIFPTSSVLMIEGQKDKAPFLEAVSKAFGDVDYRTSLLGATEADVSFNIYETASSVLKEHNDTGARIESRRLTTLDQLVKDNAFQKPSLIKIDTQGYELEILKGGMKTLCEADVVLLEVSMLNIYKESPLVDDVLFFMKKNGFVLYDICSLMRRPYDYALFQSDFMFVKEDSFLRSSKRWD